MATFKFRNLKNGQAIAIPPGEFTVGRAEDAYVHIDDSSISRHHARVLNTPEGLFVEDLGSANGVALNGAYVKGRARLSLGDLVHVGSMPFRIDPEVAGEAVATPSVGLRRVDRAQLRKDTDKISLADAMASLEKETPSSAPLIRKSVPLPTLARITAHPEPIPPQAPLSTPAPETHSAPVHVAPAQHAAAPVAPESSDPPAVAPWWWLAIFLAGLGTGLVLALYFVKFFLEMGGKVSSLP